MRAERNSLAWCQTLLDASGWHIADGPQLFPMLAETQACHFHYTRCRLDQAMALHKEQERICRQLGNPSGLATSLINQASIQAQRRQFREAIALAEQALETAQSSGLEALAQQIQPNLARIRSQASGQPQ